VRGVRHVLEVFAPERRRQVVGERVLVASLAVGGGEGLHERRELLLRHADVERQLAYPLEVEQAHEVVLGLALGQHELFFHEETVVTDLDDERAVCLVKLGQRLEGLGEALVAEAVDVRVEAEEAHRPLEVPQRLARDLRPLRAFFLHLHGLGRGP
jgi:hypothetical protein